ncbi:MAG: amylo-alpha-1,6-glucosidase [Bacteroidia bacterium]|nr:amylo-alpha-1,6-glucosidase [Bacteroidia bacterium]
MIRFSNPSFEDATSREWLISNGQGGYASSSLCGANTRRYHGLLVAALNPPTHRQVLVSKVEETLVLPDGELAALSANRYPGAIHPQGHRYLSAFERSPLPQATYTVGEACLRKTICMKQGSATTAVIYTNSGSQSLRLRVVPLLVARDYHGLFREQSYFDFYHEDLGNGQLRVYPQYGVPPLHISFGKGTFTPGKTWYRAFQYEREAYRGLDYHEDAFALGVIEWLLEPGREVILVFSAESMPPEEAPETWIEEEIARLRALPPAGVTDPFVRDLAISGDQFLVWRRSTRSYTLLAGYHWFTDWGRDTMIAMRGLVIAQGRQQEAASILQTFLDSLDQGMIPNRFPDQGEIPEYNTIDATLWLFVVLYEYYERFQDLKFIREVFPRLHEILEAHFKGTRYGIHVTEEGLLFGGEGIVQLTWMDARIGDYVVTPRHGCAVEVNALWYNALRIYEVFHRKLSTHPNPYARAAEDAEAAFRRFFLNERGYLNDVVIPGSYSDDSLRPNQIYALSLPFSPLSREASLPILALIEAHLYTDLGLRSLDPAHPDFKPVYRGNIWQRDTAYHQGTVWAFLWGEYALAYLKLHDYSTAACRTIRTKAEGLQRHFYEADCLHGISEIFDGGTPGPGRGCVHQAWSVGMMLRVLLDPAWKSDA